MEKYDFVVWVSCVACVAYVALATQHTERDIQNATYKKQKTKSKRQKAKDKSLHARRDRQGGKCYLSLHILHFFCYNAPNINFFINFAVSKHIIMKIKQFILIGILSISFVSCKYLGFKSDKEQAAPAPETEMEAEAQLTLPKSKAFYTDLLEKFFQQHYDDCFKGNTYKEGTCSVIKLVFSGQNEDAASAETGEASSSQPTADATKKDATSDGQDEVEVVGTHTYIGPAGYDVAGQKFKAIISIVEDGFNIDVYRESTQILTSKSFWERGAGNFVFVN